MTKDKFDLLSISYFIMKKEASPGARHGKSEEQCDHHLAKTTKSEKQTIQVYS